MLENPWIPQRIKEGITVKQAEFLCYDGREALFGGAAGPGKSTALLIAALQYVEASDYAALLLRRTFKQLAKADSILSKAKEWLLPLKVRYNGDDHKFTFPSGATLEFGHMDHEDAKHDYQGGAWSMIGVDEATQFTPSMLAYPRTRQRRLVGSLIPIRWRGASNPGGVSHEYVKNRYIKTKDGKNPATPDRQFFRATLADNPHIDRADYVRQLRESGVDPITLAQLLAGDWDAYQGGRFKAEWFRRFTDRYSVYGLGTREIPHEDVWHFMTVDPAASSEDTAKTDDPDYTVIAVWGVTPAHDLLWADCFRERLEIPDIVPFLQRVYERWQPQFVSIETVAANRAVYQLARRTSMIVEEVSPGGKDKLVRATPAMTLAADGRIWLPEVAFASDSACLVEDVEAELLRFTGDGKKDAHDDVVDCLSYAAQKLGGHDLDDAMPFTFGKMPRRF